jgi:hypothetical protein
MSKRFSMFIKWGIIGIWLCLVFILISRHYISGSELTPLQTLSESQFKTSEEWFSIYVQNHKIGYLNTVVEKIGAEYRFSQFSETNIPTKEGAVRSSANFTCLTDLHYMIKSFNFESRSGESFVKSHGELDENNMLLVFIETDKQKRTQAEKIEGHPYFPITVKYMLYEQGLEKGKRFSVPILNVFTLKVDNTITEVQDLIPVKVGIYVNTVYLLKTGGSYLWINDAKRTLKEQNPAGFVYFADSKDFAKSMDKVYLFDYLSIPEIKSDERLPDPERLSRLKIRLSGVKVSDYPLLNEGNQVLKGDVLEISKETEKTFKEKKYALPYQGKGLEQYLKPTPFVQSDHHTIIYNAKKFIDIEKDSFRLTRYLVSNLYLSISKTPLFRLSNSMDIFKSRTGDCNEHTVLFTSFARASGLPTRMVGGLVFRYGFFYYHVWPEVWFDGWVPVDPTLGQFPADVTHIRFVEGDIDKIASFGNIIKDIKIDIIEAL